MTYFDYLETKFTVINKSMATGNPKDVTVPRQAQVNAVIKLIGMSRTTIQWGYIGYLICSILLIKLQLKSAPAFESSIPEYKPTKPVLVPNPAPEQSTGPRG
jgi:hypothetical protein